MITGDHKNTAIAIAKDLAEEDMCLPFLIEKINPVSIKDLSQNFLYLIKKNGILLPSGENLSFKHIKEKKMQ